MHGKRNGDVCIMVIYVAAERDVVKGLSSERGTAPSDVSIHPHGPEVARSK